MVHGLLRLVCVRACVCQRPFFGWDGKRTSPKVKVEVAVVPPVAPSVSAAGWLRRGKFRGFFAAEDHRVLDAAVEDDRLRAAAAGSQERCSRWWQHEGCRCRRFRYREGRLSCHWRYVKRELLSRKQEAVLLVIVVVDRHAFDPWHGVRFGCRCLVEDGCCFIPERDVHALVEAASAAAPSEEVPFGVLGVFAFVVDVPDLDEIASPRHFLGDRRLVVAAINFAVT
mmetsp:Transcript_25952/g.55551  ORF Transcript_25952/g.55551 Transcript_25952/m.55551 type:complete len:226 (-) Transcript_25952:275-952(-)